MRIRIQFPDADWFARARARNLSRGGIGVACEAAHPPGTPVRFEIELDPAEPVVRGEGRVVWSDGRRVGIAFTTLDLWSRDRIGAFLGPNPLFD